MILNDIEKKEYDEFIYSHKNGIILQTSGWAEIKKDWKSEYCIVRDENGKIKGACLALIRKFPFMNYSLVYCPCGPVCDYNDYDTIYSIHCQLKEIAKKYKAANIKLDTQVLADNKEYIDYLKSLGYTLKNDYYDFEGIQYRFTVKVDISKSLDDILKSFKAKTRYEIRNGLKNCKTRLATRDEIAILSSLMDETANKHSFSRRPMEYFLRLYDTFAPDHCAVFICGDEEDDLSATVCMVCSDTAMYLYGANSLKKQKSGANYAVQLAMYEWAKSKGAKVFDMCGVPKNPGGKHNGLYVFKTKFGNITEFAGEFDYVTNRFGYFIFNTAKKYMKYVRRLQRKKYLKKKGE